MKQKAERVTDGLESSDTPLPSRAIFGVHSLLASRVPLTAAILLALALFALTGCDGGGGGGGPY